MNLFNDEISATDNLLPYDGEVYYYGQVMRKQSADDFLQALLQTIAWRHD